MIKDFLVSFQDNLKEKTKNPFLGTYLVVWLIRNWRLVFTVFNFDENFSLDEKIKWIEIYYSEKDFIWNLVNNIGWAFLVLVLTYILLNISRLIINFSEKRVTPHIYKITDSNSIVLKETYDNLSQNKNNLEIKLEKERDNKLKLQEVISRLEQDVENLVKEKSNLENNWNNNPPSFDKESDNPFRTKNNLSDYERIQFDKLQAKGYLDSFLNFALDLPNNNGWRFKDEEDNKVKYYLKLGLFQYLNTTHNQNQYTLTKEGENVLREVRISVD